MASLRIAIEDSSQTSEARRAARSMAAALGFDEAQAERVAIVVTEVATNILKHAGRGEILLHTVAASEPGGSGLHQTGLHQTGLHQNAVRSELELLGLDRGPGMGDLDQCLRDGFSTGGSSGQGLGAIQRLSNDSGFYTIAGKGTVILARWPVTSGKFRSQIGSRAALRIGAVNVCKPGQEVCGDSWGVEQTEEATTILVADGLGHGYEASLASQEAVRMLRENPDLTPMALVERAHSALRSSRGAAVAVARIDHARGKVTFSGVGNVAAQIYSGAQAGQHLVSVNGTAGHQTQRIREFSYPWPEHGILVLHSDGLSTGTRIDTQPALALEDPSLIAGVLYRDFCRGLDDATVVVAKAA